jgi:hypothetical protein
MTMQLVALINFPTSYLFLIFFLWVVVRLESICYTGHYWAYCISSGVAGGMKILKEITCSSATLSATNPTRHCLGSNQVRRDWKPATNRLSYGTADTTNFSEHDNYNIADSRSSSEEISQLCVETEVNFCSQSLNAALCIKSHGLSP